MGDAAQEMLAGLVKAVRLSAPEDIPALLAEQGTALGADSVTIYLADLEQYQLVPVPGAGSARQPLPIEATLAGRCFRQLELQSLHGGGEIWVPLLDGLERLGVMQLEFGDPQARADDELLHGFAALVAEIVLVKDAYGDLFKLVRRQQSMTLAAEIAWNLMPPLTFGTERVVISCTLAPSYDVGGDSFDYAVDHSTARMAIFDAMGHGLNAGLLATVAIAAYRRARRTGRTLTDTVAAVDAAVADVFVGEQFVTAVFGELDLASGRFTWHSAGHPAPLLVRGARVVKVLDTDSGLPLGLGASLGARPAVAAQSLEPGDRVLLYSDGVVEARDAGGAFFGLDRLADLVSRETAAGQPAPESMRRLMHAILDHQAGALQDDATMVLVEWETGDEQRVVPAKA